MRRIDRDVTLDCLWRRIDTLPNLLMGSQACLELYLQTFLFYPVGRLVDNAASVSPDYHESSPRNCQPQFRC